MIKNALYQLYVYFLIHSPNQKFIYWLYLEIYWSECIYEMKNVFSSISKNGVIGRTVSEISIQTIFKCVAICCSITLIKWKWLLFLYGMAVRRNVVERSIVHWYTMLSVQCLVKEPKSLWVFLFIVNTNVNNFSW